MVNAITRVCVCVYVVLLVAAVVTTLSDVWRVVVLVHARHRFQWW